MFLDQHNQLRPFRGGSDMECVKASNADLIAIAQTWANDCTVNHHAPITSPVSDSCGGPVGEAVHYSTTRPDPPNTVFALMAEGDFNYDHGTNACTPVAAAVIATCDNYKQVGTTGGTKLFSVHYG